MEPVEITGVDETQSSNISEGEREMKDVSEKRFQPQNWRKIIGR